MTAPSRRESLLQAANRVVSQRGGSALTLDAVAAEAGVSKGGILYHFPSKEALIQAMIDTEVEAVAWAIEQALRVEQSKAPEASQAGAFARAYIRVSFSALDSDMSLGTEYGGLLAAVANDMKVLEGYRKKTQEWQARMCADGLDSVRAELIRLCVDGLYYSLLIGTALPTQEELQKLQNQLIDLSYESQVKQKQHGRQV